MVPGRYPYAGDGAVAEDLDLGCRAAEALELAAAVATPAAAAAATPAAAAVGVIPIRRRAAVALLLGGGLLGGVELVLLQPPPPLAPLLGLYGPLLWREFLLCFLFSLGRRSTGDAGGGRSKLGGRPR